MKIKAKTLENGLADYAGYHLRIDPTATYIELEKYVYIKGDENTDGSIRFVKNEETGNALIEKRVDGIWQPGSMEAGATSLFVGKRVGIAGIGHHIAAKDVDGLLHFHAHSDFDGETTISDAKIINAYHFEIRKVLQPDNSGSYTGQSWGSGFYAVTPVLTKQRYFQTDTIAPTTPVTIKVYEGISESGILIHEQTYPPSDFPASSEIALLMKGYQETKRAQNYYLKITCDTDFSIKTNAAISAPWIAVDDVDIREDDMLQTKPWENGDTFTIGQWVIESKLIYVCNTAGVQTGTFAENIDKWDILGTENIFTPGSIPFAGSDGKLTEDNTKFFWDASNDRFGINVPIPLARVHSRSGFFVIDSSSYPFSLSKRNSQGEQFSSNPAARTPALIFNSLAQDRPEISYYRGGRSRPEFSIRMHTTNDRGAEIWSGDGQSNPAMTMAFNRGNVGIGISSPSHKVHIIGGNLFVDGNSGALWVHRGSVNKISTFMDSTYNDLRFAGEKDYNRIGTWIPKSFQIVTDSTDRIIIDRYGRVEIINSLTIDNDLTVNDDIFVYGDIFARNHIIDRAVVFHDNSTQQEAGERHFSQGHMNTAIYSGDWYDASSEDMSERDMHFSPDGLTMYVIGLASGGTGDCSIWEYPLTIPWDLSTVGSPTIKSIETYGSNQVGLFIDIVGRRLWTVCTSNDTVIEYSMNPWNISSLQWVQAKDISGQDTSPSAVFWSANGDRLFLAGDSDNDIVAFSVSSEWDISGISWFEDFSTDINAPTGLHFSSDGRRMYVMDGSAEDDIHEFHLSSPWMISSARLANLFNVSAENSSPQGIFLTPDNSKIFMVGTSTPDGVYGYELGIETNGAIISNNAPIIPGRMTQTQRDALTPAPGMVIYNTTIQKHQGYSSSWNNFY